MKPAIVQIVRVPPSVWNSVPVERPLASVCRDVEASQRRIRKGVDLARERARYIQLCGWIEETVLNLIAAHKATAILILNRDDTERYLLLIETLQTAPSLLRRIRTVRRQTTLLTVIGAWVRAWVAFDMKERRRRRLVAALLTREWKNPAPLASAPPEKDPPLPLGRGFFSPGGEVEFQARLFRSLSLTRLAAMLPKMSPDDLALVAEMAAKRADLFAAAARSGSGVVEVLSAAP